MLWVVQCHGHLCVSHGYLKCLGSESVLQSGYGSRWLFGIDSGLQSPFRGWFKVRTKSNGMYWVTVNVGRVWDKGKVGHSVKIVKRPTLGFLC